MNTLTKHTPGPWEFGELIRERGTFSISQASTSDRIAMTDSTAFPHHNARANAALIAAAPELLAALEDLVRVSEMESSTSFAVNAFAVNAGFDLAVINARAAIAKAKGQP